MPDFKPVFIVMKREVRDQLRDWRITMPIFVLTLIFPAIMNFAAERMVAFVEQFGAEIIAERLIPFLLLVVGFFPISVSLVIALESFVGEKERGSIEPLLTSPFENWQLYMGKLVAVMVPPLVAAYFGITIYLIGVNRSVGWVAEPELLAQVISLTFVQCLVMVSGAVVISTQATSVRAANLLASFVIVPMAFLVQGEAAVMFWGEYGALWWAVAGLAVIAVLLIRTGVGYFNREELLGRTLDVLDPRGMFRTIWNAFEGEATSVWSWWSGEVLSSVKKIRGPFLVLMFLFAGALLVGASQTRVFPLPPEFIQLDVDAIQGFQDFNLFSNAGIFYIWRHNLRVLLGAFLIGVFSYGVLGIMVILLPFFIIGYIIATFATAGLPAWQFFMVFILPHGIFEIPALLLAGASIYKLGANVAGYTQQKSIMEGLLHSFADWAKIMIGVVVPVLLIASIVEAKVTPQVAVWFLERLLQ